MKKKNNVILRKIPIAVLMNALNDIYSLGIDYVDIAGVNDSEQDIIELRYREEYVIPETNSTTTTQAPTSISKEPPSQTNNETHQLSDDDLSELTD